MRHHDETRCEIRTKNCRLHPYFTTAMEAGVELVVAVAIDVKTPVAGVIRKTVMSWDVWLPTKRNLPVVSARMKDGEVPAEYGGAGVVVITVGTPVVPSMVNA